MFQRLLICTDLNDGLQRLTQFVPYLTSEYVQHVTFLHVVPIDGRGVPRPDEAKMSAARTKLAVAEQSVPAGVEVKVEVQAGQVVERIMATAKANQVDLIVVGTESRSLLSEKLFGSTGATLCQNNQIPVLIVRPQLISTYTVEELKLRCQHLLRYFLIPYDGGKTADYLVSQVKHHREKRAEATFQECLLLWVIDENDQIDKLLHESRIKEAEAKLAKARAELEQEKFTVHTKIAFGEPIPETLKAAMDYDITAIAIASATMGRLSEWSRSSFTGELLRRSWHPVLVFPPLP